MAIRVFWLVMSALLLGCAEEAAVHFLEEPSSNRASETTGIVSYLLRFLDRVFAFVKGWMS
jgi:hypothetical protein